MSRWDPDEDEVKDTRPYDFEGAKRAVARASRDQLAAAQDGADAAQDAAEKERRYREALSAEIVRQHAEGVAWSVASDVARGVPEVARLRYERDVAQGVLKACEERSWTASANRRQLDKLVDWSMRVAPDGQEADRPGLRPVGSAA